MEQEFPGCSTSDSTLNNLLLAMEELGFMIKLPNSLSNYNVCLFPSLRPVGSFRLFYEQGHSSQALILGRRVARADSKPILSFWFCKFQVPIQSKFVPTEKITITGAPLRLFCELCEQTPFLYSNGVVFSFCTGLKLQVILSEKRLHIDFVLSGKNPAEIWEMVLKVVENDTMFKFNNTQTFPLVLEHIPSQSQSEVSQISKEEQQFIFYGKAGQLQQAPFPWTFLSGVDVNVSHKSHPNVKLLELKPPLPGQQWKTKAHEHEYERVKQAFQYFVGVDGMRTFKLDKVELIQNDELEGRFLSMYNFLSHQQLTHATEKMNQKEMLWQESILSQVDFFFL